MSRIVVATFQWQSETAEWEPGACDGDAYRTERAAALYAALGVDRDDDEYTLAAHHDGRWALIGLAIAGHRWAYEEARPSTTFNRAPGDPFRCAHCSKSEGDHVWRCDACGRRCPWAYGTPLQCCAAQRTTTLYCPLPGE